MNRKKLFRIGLIVLGGLGLSALGWQASRQEISSAPTAPPVLHPLSPPIPTGQVQAFDHLPLAFEVNQGQTDRQVQFLAHQGSNTLFLTPNAAVFRLQNWPASADQKETRPGHLSKTVWQTHTQARSSWALRMELVGADPQAQPHPEAGLPGHVNYLIGNDPRRWHTGIPLYSRARYAQVYPGVDLVYYGQNQQLEYDFVVAPGANPSQIGLRFAGASGVQIDKTGSLIVHGSGGTLQWKPPVVYQERGVGKRSLVSCGYVLHQEHSSTPIVRLALGRYDRQRSLVIDPVLVYSTYLGGTGNDVASALALDSAGNVYVAGTASSTNFPTTPGAYQATNKTVPQGGNTAFLTKFNSAGNALIYSTYLGGSGGDYAYALALDGAGNAYVAGYTNSTDFPITPGAFQSTNKGSADAFITKLKPDGTGLLYSTYLGGGGSGGQVAVALALDSAGNAYVAGYTYATDFPTTPGAFQTSNKGGADTFLTKLNANGSALLYSTYLGGTGNDVASALALDSAGNAYVAGQTYSTDFPTTPGAFQSTNKVPQNNSTAFLTKLNSNGNALIYSTYLGGTTKDNANALAVDSAGNAYVAGYTNSTDFPITPGAFQTTNKGSADAFITKLKPDGTGLLYSTYLGGTSYDSASALALDSAGNAYVAGYTSSTNFSTTPGAFQTTSKSVDAFLIKLNSAGSALIYSTYLGGTDYDSASALVLDSAGNAYVAGTTRSTDFPTTLGTFQTTNKGAAGGHTNAFVSKFSFASFDFNRDGHPDLVFQNQTTNQVAVWYMNAATLLGGASLTPIPSSGYKVVTVGDFKGDGNPDLVYQNQTSNQVAIGFLHGVTYTGGGFTSITPPAGWKVVGSGDFNDDGKADLVYQNQTTNQVAVWYMNGLTYSGSGLITLTPASGWKVVGVGDFNGDGHPDLVFQNQTTNQIAVWYLNGLTYIGGAQISLTPLSGWKVVAVADMNGDGKPDLGFQNQSSNQAVIWFMNGTTYAGSAATSTTPVAGWKIVGPR